MNGTCMESRKTLQQADSHKRAVFFYAKSKFDFHTEGREVIGRKYQKTEYG